MTVSYARLQIQSSDLLSKTASGSFSKGPGSTPGHPSTSRVSEDHSGTFDGRSSHWVAVEQLKDFARFQPAR